MPILRRTGRAGTGDAGLDHGIRDIEIVATSRGLFALTASGDPRGGFVTYALSAQGGPRLVDTDRFRSPEIGTVLTDPVEGDLATAAGDRLWLRDVDAGGRISGPRSVALGGADPQRASAAWADRDHLVLAEAGGLLRLYAANGDGSYAHQDAIRLRTAGTAWASVSDLASVEVGSSSVLLAADAAGQRIVSYGLGADGLTQRDSFGASDGLGMMTPIAIETVRVGGADYAVVASGPSTGSSGALSVMRVGPDGGLIPTDHVVDTRGTRFGGVQDIAAVETGGRAWIVAAGGDMGLSLLTLLPGGRLVHLQTLEQAHDGHGLGGVRSLAIARVGDALQILAASETEAGVTQFTLPLGGLGRTYRVADGGGAATGGGGHDVVMGGAGADSLVGGGGDDILLDGAGADRMRGGPGRDVFVLEADGARDRIDGFDPGEDRLDLSSLPFLYDPQAVAITFRSWGAELGWREETVELRPAAGADLSERAIRDAIAEAPYRSFRMPSVEWTGTDRDETVSGDWGVDTLSGGGGRDHLTGEGGDDSLSGGTGSDRLYGGSGADIVAGGVGADRLDGGTGDDRLYGGSGNDTILGGSGADRLYGGAGHDRIEGQDGDDRVRGGDGRDVIELDQGNDWFEDERQTGWAGRDTVYGGRGDDTLIGRGGNDRLEGGLGQDSLTGGIGDDRVYGGRGNDFIEGHMGHDDVRGGGGADLVHMGQGRDSFRSDTRMRDQDIVYGGSGGDTIVLGGGHDRAYGGDDRDLIEGKRGRDLLDGGGARDTLYGGSGNDTLLGGSGDDSVYGGSGRDLARLGSGDDLYQAGSRSRDGDRVEGERGDDTIILGGGDDQAGGGRGDDRIEGRRGDDRIDGGSGDDALFGGSGDDEIRGGAGRDSVDLGDGNDVFRDEGESGRSGRDTVYGGDGRDRIEGGGGDDRFYGGAARDDLRGGRGDDRLTGGANGDRLDGGSGDDLLEGGRGDDRLEGGAGLDRLDGGSGADVFVFTASGGSDRVADFDPDEDRLAFEGIARGGVDLGRGRTGAVLDWDGGQVVLEGMSHRDVDMDELLFW